MRSLVRFRPPPKYRLNDDAGLLLLLLLLLFKVISGFLRNWLALGPLRFRFAVRLIISTLSGSTCGTRLVSIGSKNSSSSSSSRVGRDGPRRRLPPPRRRLISCSRICSSRCLSASSRSRRASSAADEPGGPDGISAGIPFGPPPFIGCGGAPSASSYSIKWLNSSRPSTDVSRGSRPAASACGGLAPGGLIIGRLGGGIIPEEVLTGPGRPGPFIPRGGGAEDMRGGGCVGICAGTGGGEGRFAGLVRLVAFAW